MKYTVEKDALVNTLVAVSKVFLKPYGEFVAQLLKDGRIQQEEVDRLNVKLREETDKISEIVTKSLSGDSD